MQRKLGYETNCWGALGGDGVGVTSIGRLVYRTFADMARAISEIGAVGYDGVELFDGNLLDYEDRKADFRSLLSDAGVELVATYSGGNFIFPDVLTEELEKIRRVAAVTADLGGKYLVVGGGAKRLGGIQAGDPDRLGAGLDAVDDIARSFGLVATYHPHLTTMAETPEQVRDIFSRTRIGFCPATAHLAAGGADVPALVRELHTRIPYIHLKGWQRNPFAFTPLDTGDLDQSAILRVLDEVKYTGWITVELDSWPDPKEGAQRSLEFLRRHAANS